MFLADYAVSDKLAVAFRFLTTKCHNSLDVQNHNCSSLRNYDSLGAILRVHEYESGQVDANLLAVELTYTF